MKMKKKYKVMLSILIIIILVVVGLLIYKNFLDKPDSKEENPATNTSKVTNEIEGYQYTLEDRDTKLFASTFKNLKKLLEETEENENKMEDYATYLSELFIIDLYTISNKITKYDIGGLEYIYENAKSSFRSKVLDTIYKTVEDDSYETRTQELPTVSEIKVEKLEKTNVVVDETNYSAYLVTLSWSYEKDLGYDNRGKVTLIEKENKLYIVSFEP